MKTKITYGDILLMHGDAIEKMKEIPSGSIDMIKADIPFGTTRCKWDSIIPFEPMWEQIIRITTPNAAIILNAAQPFTSALIMSNPKIFRYTWVYKKRNAKGHLNSKRMPMKAHEDVVVFYKKPPTYNPQKTTGHKPVNNFYTRESGEVYGKADRINSGGGNTDRFPISIQEFKFNKKEPLLHPTQKPLEMEEYLIKTYSNKGDTILDFTIGSGTTMLACQNLNRKAIGIDNGFCNKNKTINNIHLKGMRWIDITLARLQEHI